MRRIRTSSARRAAAHGPRPLGRLADLLFGGALRAASPRGRTALLRPALLILSLALPFASPLAAQQRPLTGFTSDTSERQRALETRAIESIQPAALDSFARALTDEFRIAAVAAPRAARRTA